MLQSCAKLGHLRQWHPCPKRTGPHPARQIAIWLRISNLARNLYIRAVHSPGTDTRKKLMPRVMFSTEFSTANRIGSGR